MSLNKIKQIEIPRNILVSTFDFLQECGMASLESHALWVGEDKEDIFYVSDVWFPEQLNSSISYEVPEEEEFRINRKLNEMKLTIISQVHTHPGSAFHSSIDDEGSELALPGSLSVVIPNFGFIQSDNLDEWEVYRYTGTLWKHVSKNEVRRLFRIM
jgi:hypothetical protein